MSTTEALRTRLDVLQTEYYQLQPENKRLRETDPQQTQLVDVEGELAQTREEDVRLAQKISELSHSSKDADDAREEIEQGRRETIARVGERSSRAR